MNSTFNKTINNKRGDCNLKILFVSHEFGIGGATKSLLSLVRGIQQISPDIECKVIFPLKPGKESTAYRLFQENKICCQQVLYRQNHKRIGSKYSLKHRLFDALNYIASKKLQKIICKGQYHIVCSNSTAVSVGAIAAINCGVPHIQYIREMMEEDFGVEYRDKSAMKKIIEKSAGVIFISEFVKNKYLNKYAISNWNLFHVGINIDDYYIEKHEILSESAIKIIQTGTFKEGKGTKSTIRIMKGLIDCGFNSFTCSFIGDGDKKYVSEMEELIAEYKLVNHIQIFPFTNNIRDYLKEADIVVMNSVAEGFGRVTVEAMAAGCLVLGKNAGGTKEIISDGENGLLFLNEKDAVSKLLQIVQDKNHYAEVAKKGQNYAIDNYSEKITAQNFIEFLRTI